MLKKSKNFILNHKIKVIIILAVIISISYFSYTKFSSSDSPNKYVFGTATKGVLISSVSGTGQVSPVNQIDLKPKASGDIIFLNAVAGTKVSAGTIIAKLDTKDVSANVRDANMSLENAKLSYEKYQTQNSDEKLLANLTKSYDVGYSAVSTALVDIPTILNNLEDLNRKDSLSRNNAKIIGGSLALQYFDKSEEKFYIAQTSINTLIKNYRGIERKSTNKVIDQSLSDTYKSAKLLSDAIKSKKDFVDYLYEESEKSNTYSSFQISLGQYSTTINSDLSSLLSAITSIQDSTSAYSDKSIGIKTSALSVKERQNSLQDAKDKLEDYIVRAPFDGLIAKSDAKLGDSAGASTVIATLITRQKLAEIPLNEVDVAKVKIGQKATLTFDAISDLSISGQVSEIDLVGTESQGVVTYNVKISFDTQDDKIKPGMSVSASIITDIKSDVILVPNSAVKTQNGTRYVETSDELVVNTEATSSSKGVTLTLPVSKKSVEVGLSNDEFTEIISGLNDGDKIITRTITSTNASKSTTAVSTQGVRRQPGGGFPGM